VETEGLHEVFVRALNGGAKVLGKILRMIGAVAVVRPDDLAEVLDDGGDGDRARYPSASAAPHAIGDSEQIRPRSGQSVEDVRVVEVRLAHLNGALEGGGDEVVLVHGPDLTGMGHPIALDEPPAVCRLA
jgi:hypothetical protein